MKNKVLKTILTVFFLLLLFCGLYLILEPNLERWQTDAEIKKALDSWKISLNIRAEEQNPIAPTEEVYPELLAAMKSYNEEIYKNGQSDLVDAWSYQSELFDLTEYGVTEDAAGYITIPAIDVELPLYLGANETNLSKGFAQLSQTSMPIGGNSTNCVVACHRGYRGTKFLRDADKLKVGDIVILQNFWESLTYKICEEPKTIEPHEIEEVLIQPDRDLLTIVTCTPYGIGSHRLIIFCERVE